MSSMTIDQLKKSLTEQGITLPPSRSKKADYIKLYKQYSTMNDSLGDVYGSDDENPTKTGSQSVTSSTSPGRNDNIAKEVVELTDDELYNQLKEFDANIGPVLKNTRRVYEKKLIKLLSASKGVGNYEIKTNSENSFPPADEFSDSDVEIISKSSKRSELNTRKSSVLRDSPKPSLPESSKPDVKKTYFSNYEYSNRSSIPSYSNDPKPSRYSYIETIPKGSSYGYIEQSPEIDFSSDIRQRFTNSYKPDKFNSGPFSSEKYSLNKSDGEEVYKPKLDIGWDSQYKIGMKSEDQFKSGFNIGGQSKPSSGVSNKNKFSSASVTGRENYIGSWEPNINRYLASGAQKKTSSAGQTHSGLLKNILAGLLLLAILVVFIYLCQQWFTTDPYKVIEDDAERTIQQLKQESNDY